MSISIIIIFLFALFLRECPDSTEAARDRRVLSTHIDVSSTKRTQKIRIAILIVGLILPTSLETMIFKKICKYQLLYCHFKIDSY